MKISSPQFLQKAAFSVAIVCSLQACNNPHDAIEEENNHGDTGAAVKTVVSGSVPKLNPAGDKPAWAPGITDNMQVIMDKLASYGDPAIETVDAQQARKLHTPTNAVMDVMTENKVAMPAALCDTSGKDIAVNGGTIHVRIYTPKNGEGPFPLVVYYHGGGWVIADNNTYDASARALSEQAGAVVVSVEYRKGPEHKFPTAHNDAFAAYQWALKNAGALKADSSNVAVAGESAGGNLALNVSMMARDKKITMPVRQVLVYPVASKDMNSESYLQFAAAKPLNKPMMHWFAKNHLGDTLKAANKRIDLVNANLNGLPPTTIIAAEIDPLQTEGKLLAGKLKAAGVEVNYQLYKGVTHEFFGMATLLQEAKVAQATVASDLKHSFKK